MIRENETTRELVNEATDTMARMPFIDQHFVLRDTIIKSIIQEVALLSFSEGYRQGLANQKDEIQKNPVLVAAGDLLKFVYEVKAHHEASFNEAEKTQALDYLAAMASSLISRLENRHRSSGGV